MLKKLLIIYIVLNKGIKVELNQALKINLFIKSNSSLIFFLIIEYVKFL